MIVKAEVHTHGLDSIQDSLQEAAGMAEHILAQQVRADTSPYVPMLTGSLDIRTRVVEDKVIYPGPYARFLYYGKLMIDPKTGSAWARRGAVKVLTDRNLVFSRAAHSEAQSHWFEASKAQNLGKWLRVADKAVKYKHDQAVSASGGD